MPGCRMCGAGAVTVRRREERFVYGSGDDESLLSTVVSVIECSECGGITAQEGAPAEDAPSLAIRRPPAQAAQ